ncbi:MAG: glycosyltransferase family 4 protein, partial [Candidatus Methanomethylicaceae archaeon]
LFIGSRALMRYINVANKFSEAKMLNRRILIFHDILWSYYKGAVFSELYNLLIEQGFEPLFVHIALTTQERTRLGDPDYSVHRYPYKVLFNKPLNEIGYLNRALAVAQTLLEFRPHLVVLPGYADLCCWAGLLVAKVLGSKVIIAIDSTEADKPRKWYKEFAKRIFCDFSDGAFCYGTASACYARKLGIRRIFLRCQACPNEIVAGICQDARTRRDELQRVYGFKKRNFIYVGRLAKEKNVSTLIRAFHIATKEKADWGLLIVGDGPEREALESLVDHLGLRDRTFFAGGKSWREVPSFYALADVLVLPSISEPWGLVVNEAMACGLPVVVSNKAGAAWDLVIDGENGFTFNPYKLEELVDIMRKFVNGEVNVQEMGRRSMEIIRIYTPRNAAKQMMMGIKEILDMR